MMRTIYKYPLETVDTQIIEVPGIFGFGNSFNKQFLRVVVKLVIYISLRLKKEKMDCIGSLILMKCMKSTRIWRR